MPVRLLHTADWHVGKRLHGVSRDDEHRAVLAEMADLATRHEVDAVVVAGDLFDQPNPSAEASTLVHEGLLALREAAGRLVVVTGNHDSPRRWLAVDGLLRAAGIDLIAEVRPPEDGGRVTIRGRDGSECDLIGLPWIFERRLARTATALGIPPAGDYREGMRGVLAHLCAAQRDRGVPQVLVGHAHLGEAEVGPDARLLPAGGSHAIPAGVFPESLSYVALGHIHKPQRLTGAAVPTHYAGSPLQLDFGEAGEGKSVCLVDVEPGRPAAVRELGLTDGRPLTRLRGTLDELEEQQVHADHDCWLGVTVRCTRAEPGLADRAREICPRAIAIDIDPLERPVPERRSRPSVRGLGPRALFRQYLIDARGAEDPPEADLDLFEEVLSGVEHDDGAADGVAGVQLELAHPEDATGTR